MARINIRNGNIKVSNTEPVAGQEFTVTVPANNREIFGGGEYGCKRDRLTQGHLADIGLTVRHETLGVVQEETKEGVCVPLDQIGSSSVGVDFDVTVSRPGEVTIIATIDPRGDSPPDQEPATVQVIDTGESDPAIGPGSGNNGGNNGINLPDPPGDESPLLAFAIENPGATLALAGGAAIAISSFTSSIAE